MQSSLRRDGERRPRELEHVRRLRCRRGVKQFRSRTEREFLQRIACSTDIQIVLPQSRRAPQAVRRALEALPDLIVVTGIELPHIVAVDEIDDSFFARLYQQVRWARSRGLIRHQDACPGSQVSIGLLKRLLVIWGKPAGYAQIHAIQRVPLERVQPENAVSIVIVGRWITLIEVAISRADVNVSTAVHRRRSASSPDA